MTRPIARISLTLFALTVIPLIAPRQARGAGPAVGSRSPLAPAAKWIALDGSVSPAVRLARRLAPLPARTPLGLTVEMRLRNLPALQALLRDQVNPASQRYGRFLTVTEFRRRFAPTTEQRDRLTAWLRREGLRVVGVPANGLAVQVRGPAGRVAAAFGTRFSRYRRGARHFFANDRPVRLPGAIAPAVVAVAGLTNAARQRPLGLTRVDATNTSGGYSPADLSRLYNLDPLRARGIDGRGQTIGLVSFGQFDPANVATYDTRFGLTGRVTRVLVGDGVSVGAAPGGQDQSEAELDVEVAQAGAPGAQILVYEAPNNDTGFINNFNRIVGDNRASVISTSWGEYETYFPPDERKAIHQALQEAAAQGQTVFAASGDNGAYDAFGGGEPTLANQLAVDFPGSDPYVTSVGGTALQTANGVYAGETVWSEGSAQTSPGGSGGGLSVAFKRPAYQTGPGVISSYSNGMRQVPDVAAEAENGVGYALYALDWNSNQASWAQYGGTSAASPLWAGFTAMVQQALGGRVGFLNPTLYRLGQAASTFPVPPFHDVTQGTNLYYPATPGWDFATGWGSFDGGAFLQDLQNLSPVTATPIPTPRGWRKGGVRVTPTATPTPATIVITAIVLSHRVQGKQVRTDFLRLGERGTLAILYRVKRGRRADIVGIMLLRHDGRLVGTAILRPGTYGGKRAFLTTVRITSRDQAGALSARVTLSAGASTTTRSRSFKVR